LAFEAKQQAFACKNTGFFAMALMFAAKHLGLDTHPMDGFDHDAVRKEFNIPENYWIPLLMAVGHFDETKKLPPPKWRKTYEEIVAEFD
jgi:nitroreductase